MADSRVDSVELPSKTSKTKRDNENQLELVQEDDPGPGRIWQELSVKVRCRSSTCGVRQNHGCSSVEHFLETAAHLLLGREKPPVSQVSWWENSRLLASWLWDRLGTDVVADRGAPGGEDPRTKMGRLGRSLVGVYFRPNLDSAALLLVLSGPAGSLTT